MTTSTDRQPHVLVLHTSCQYDGEDDGVADESAPVSATTKKNARDAMVDEVLHSIPIACDMLILPEIPTPRRHQDSRSQSRNEQGGNAEDVPPDLVEFVQNRFNPCGLANVLVLENLPWREVLLSLTSCAMVFEDNNTMNDDGTPLLSLLPVDLNPSTFDFRLGSSSKTSDLSTTDLHLVFDATQARLQLQELLQDKHPDTANVEQLLCGETTTDQGLNVDAPRDQNREDVRDTARSSKTGGHEEHSPCRDDASFQGVHSANIPFLCESDEPIFHPSTNNNASTSTTRLRLDQELDALQRVHAIMDQDAANLDRLLQVLSFVGLGLFMALVWSGYQLYQAKMDDCRTRELRKSVQRKILLHSALSSHQHHTSTAPVLSSRPGTTMMEPSSAQQQVGSTASQQRSQKELFLSSISRMEERNICQVSKEQNSSILEELYTPRIDNRSRSRISAGARPIIPVRLDFSSLDCQVVGESSTRGGTTANKQTNRNDDDSDDDHHTFAGKSRRRPQQPLKAAVHKESSNSSDKKNLFANLSVSREESAPFTRATTTHDTTCEEMNGNGNEQDATLSPCSQLAKDWSARKTARRSHRNRKQHSKLEPLSQIARLSVPNFTSPIGAPSAAGAPRGPSSLFASLPLRLTSTSTTTVPPLVPSFSEDDVKVTIQQPRQQSLVAAGSGKNNPFIPEKELTTVEQVSSLNDASSNSSKSPSGTPTIPELVCSTPGSSESFVDDYW